MRPSPVSSSSRVYSHWFGPWLCHTKKIKMVPVATICLALGVFQQAMASLQNETHSTSKSDNSVCIYQRIVWKTDIQAQYDILPKHGNYYYYYYYYYYYILSKRENSTLRLYISACLMFKLKMFKMSELISIF